MASAAERTGTIYDIGYRRYTGERLGAAHAFWALVAHGMRTAFGVRRGARAQLGPGLIMAMAVIPAMVASATPGPASAARDVMMHEWLLRFASVLAALFCAGQAPELLGADRQHRVLGLYFTRPLRRSHYILARLVSLTTAVVLIMLLPQVVYLFGRALSQDGQWQAVKDRAYLVWPIVATVLVESTLIASIALAATALVGRRAVEGAAVLGVMLVPHIAASVVATEFRQTSGKYAVLAAPLMVADGVAAWVFPEPPPPAPPPSAAQSPSRPRPAQPPRARPRPQARTIFSSADVSGPAYGGAAAGMIALALALLMLRYRRLEP